MKIIEKQIDHYYKSILDTMLLNETFWYSDDYDFKIQEDKNSIKLMVKKKEFNDNQYVLLVDIGKSYKLMAITQFNDIRKDISKRMKKYKNWIEEGNKL